MRLALTLIASLIATPALAHDTPPVKAPGSTVVVQQPLWPEFGRIAGEGNVRLIYHSPGRAARVGVNQFHAYERAYHRRLAHLMMRMSLEAADPIARHGAWHEIVGQNPNPAFTTGPAAD